MERLQWNGQVPSCGHGVVEELRQRGELLPTLDVRDYAVPIGELSAGFMSASSASASRAFQRWKKTFVADSKRPKVMFARRTLEVATDKFAGDSDHVNASDALKTMEEVAEGEAHCKRDRQAAHARLRIRQF